MYKKFYNQVLSPPIVKEWDIERFPTQIKEQQFVVLSVKRAFRLFESQIEKPIEISTQTVMKLDDIPMTQLTLQFGYIQSVLSAYGLGSALEREQFNLCEKGRKC